MHRRNKMRSIEACISPDAGYVNRMRNIERIWRDENSANSEEIANFAISDKFCFINTINKNRNTPYTRNKLAEIIDNNKTI